MCVFEYSVSHWPADYDTDNSGRHYHEAFLHSNQPVCPVDMRTNEHFRKGTCCVMSMHSVYSMFSRWVTVDLVLISVVCLVHIQANTELSQRNLFSAALILESMLLRAKQLMPKSHPFTLSFLVTLSTIKCTVQIYLNWIEIHPAPLSVMSLSELVKY